MKNFLKSNFIIILFLLTVIFAVFVLIMGSRVPAPSPKPLPIIQASPKPTVTSEQIEQKVLLTNIRGQIFTVIDPVVLNFAQPQATPSVSIKLDPTTPFIVKQVTSVSISIEPELVWEFNKRYTFKIAVANKEYSFSFQTEGRKGI